MTTELAPEMMTTEEAHAAADEIRKATQTFTRDLGRLRALALEFHERKGWVALGYNTVEACAKNEFGWKRAQFYNQLTAGKIEARAGIPVGTTPERRIRPAPSQQPVYPVDNSLPNGCSESNKPPEMQRQAFAEAKRDGAPTAEKVRRAVERIETPAPVLCEHGRPIEQHCGACEDEHIARQEKRSENLPEMQSKPEPLVSGSVTVEGQTVTIDTPTPVSEASELVNQRVAETHAEIGAHAGDLGEIEAAVLKRHGVSVGRAAGLFSQILAAAEQGGASWEARLKGACRASFK